MRKPAFAYVYAKTKSRRSAAVSPSAFVFATQKAQFLYFLNTKFQAFNHLLLLHSPVCVGPGRKLRDNFCREVAHIWFKTK